MKEHTPLLQRVVVWGTVSFLLFVVSFWYLFFGMFEVFAKHPEIPARFYPSPIFPSLAAGTLSFIATALAIAVSSKIYLRRIAASATERFVYRGLNLELLARLLLLLATLTIGPCIPASSSLDTDRCMLFTLDEVCTRSHRVLPSGPYEVSTSVGWYAGVNPRSNEGLRVVGKFSFDQFSFGHVHAERTQYGWPLRAITRDVVPERREWHIVLETWYFVSLFLLFISWLIVQPLISAVLWVPRSISRARRRRSRLADSVARA
jgi:hypothetical protein